MTMLTTESRIAKYVWHLTARQTMYIVYGCTPMQFQDLHLQCLIAVVRFYVEHCRV